MTNSLLLKMDMDIVRWSIKHGGSFQFVMSVITKEVVGPEMTFRGILFGHHLPMDHGMIGFSMSIPMVSAMISWVGSQPDG